MNGRRTTGSDVVACDQASPFVSALVDGEEIARPIERHLQGCSRCREETAQMRRVSALLAVPELPRDPNFVVRFRLLRAERREAAEGRFWRFWSLRLAPLAAAGWLLMIALLVGADQQGEVEVEVGTLGAGSELGLRVQEDLTLAGGLAWFGASAPRNERIDL